MPVAPAMAAGLGFGCDDREGDGDEEACDASPSCSSCTSTCSDVPSRCRFVRACCFCRCGGDVDGGKSGAAGCSSNRPPLLSNDNDAAKGRGREGEMEEREEG
jgi:hypothetical protein